MNYGLYTSATGVLAGMYRQDVLANNLANVNTTGFKQDFVTFKQRDAARIEDGLLHLDSNEMLERLGAGVHVGENRVDFGQGGLESTGGDLDLALEQSGFFAVRTGASEAGEGLAFTRDGRLSLDSDGRLVLAASGLPVLDVNDRDIYLDTSRDVLVQSDGTIVQEGRPMARIQVSDFPAPERLQKKAAGLFIAPGTDLENRIEGAGRVRQGFLEGSTVDPIHTMMAISAAGRMASSNAEMMRVHDGMISRAVNTLGRVT
jgi:flagellar basal-body rod protein FlgF